MMNLYHLRYFVDAAMTGSLSEAAKKNRISQSAVSQAIRSLERSIGFQLTTHQKKVFHLTDEGKAVLEHSDGVFGSLGQLAQAIQDITKSYSGAITIGCTNSVAVGLLPPVLSELGKEHPNLIVSARVGNSVVIKDWLLRKEVDIGVFVDDGLAQNLNKLVLRSGSYLLFRGTQKQRISTGLVVTRRERTEVQYYLKQLARTSHPAHIQCEITSWEAIKSYVLHAGGHGICPDYVIENELKSKRLIAEKMPFKAPKYRLIAAHRANQPLGKNARLLIDAITNSPQLTTAKEG